MHRVALTVPLAAASLIAAAPAGGDDPAPPRLDAGAGITVRVPSGWHLVRRSLTEVTDPAQRLAIASFPVRLAARPCDCDKPHLRAFPRDGVFVFVWEYEGRFTGRQLRRVPRRAARFGVTQGTWHTACAPTWTGGFREAGRVFQVEVHLGPAATPQTRARVDALLDSLRVAPRA